MYAVGSTVNGCGSYNSGISQSMSMMLTSGDDMHADMDVCLYISENGRTDQDKT